MGSFIEKCEEKTRSCRAARSKYPALLEAKGGANLGCASLGSVAGAHACLWITPGRQQR